MKTEIAVISCCVGIAIGYQINKAPYVYSDTYVYREGYQRGFKFAAKQMLQTNCYLGTLNAYAGSVVNVSNCLFINFDGDAVSVSDDAKVFVSDSHFAMGMMLYKPWDLNEDLDEWSKE